MIDEKKITEAVNAYIGYPSEVDEGVSVSLQRKAFRAGAEWFMSTLWHDASEKPSDNRTILSQWSDGDGDMDVCIDMASPNLVWEKYVAYNHITGWCYLSDLLPKGGEK